MSEATRPLRLVPPPEGAGRTVRTFSCLGPDVLQRALAAVAAAGGPDLRFAGLQDAPETWLDTGDARILAAGLLLRVEGPGPEPVARLTPVEAAEERTPSRGRLVQVLLPGPLETAVCAAGPVGDRVRALAGRRALDRRTELVTRRHAFEGGVGVARLEISLEEPCVERPFRPGGRVACRLTIAGDEGAVDALATALEAPCELGPARPPVETALELTGVEPPAAPDLGAEEVGPDISVAALAFVNLRRHARSLLRHEPGTRLGDDPEALHDMRVAGRRMRAAFGLFETYLPKRAAPLRRELGRIGRILGAVRDLDVQLEQLAHWRSEADPSEAPAFDAIERVLDRKRRAARRRMLATLDGARYGRFVERLQAFLRRGPGPRPATGRRAALAAAPELIGRRYRAVRKLGERLTRESPPAELHALRIRAKRLRYALEFHERLYDGDVKAMIESLTALQDLLGEHQDACVAVGHLESLAAGGRRALPPRALFLMGTIAGRYGHRAAELRRTYAKTFRKIRGRRWTALKATLATSAPPQAEPRGPS